MPVSRKHPALANFGLGRPKWGRQAQIHLEDAPLREGGPLRDNEFAGIEIANSSIGRTYKRGSATFQVTAGESHPLSCRLPGTIPKRRGWINPVPYIPFTKETGDYLWNTYIKMGGPGSSDSFQAIAMDELETMKEPERSAFHSFFVNLWALQESHAGYEWDLRTIVRRSLTEGPAFAKEADAYKTFALKSLFKIELFSEEAIAPFRGQPPPWAKWVKSVGDIFRPNLLFSWKPPSPDIVAITHEPVEISDEALNRFRQKVRAYLRKGIYAFYQEGDDPLRGNKGGTSKAKEGPQYRLPTCPPANVRGVSRIAFIPRELKECRAACIEEYASLNRIRLIDQAVHKIIRFDERSKMDLTHSQLREDLEKVCWGRTARVPPQYSRLPPDHPLKRIEPKGGSRWFYCRDLKKEGLTKPRILLTIMLEEMYTLWPNDPAFSATNFFRDWSFSLDGKIYNPPRGHGLGMANALTTLMQIIIEEMVLDDIDAGDSPIWSGYFNDDAAMAFQSIGAARRYATQDEKTCLSLGLCFKSKGTFIAQDFVVLCETYASRKIRRFDDRRIVAYESAANILKAINASHARSLTINMNAKGDQRFWKKVLEYWGPILYQNEHLRPREAGGWFRWQIGGISYEYADNVSTQPLNQMEAAAHMAIRRVKFLPNAWKRELRFKTKRSEYLPEKWLLERGEEVETIEPFRPEANTFEWRRAWLKYEMCLKQSFKYCCRVLSKKKTCTWGDLYRDRLKRCPKEDIIPPPDLREFEPTTNMGIDSDQTLTHPYIGANERSDLDLWRYTQGQEAYPRQMGGLQTMELQNTFWRPNNSTSTPDYRVPKIERLWIPYRYRKRTIYAPGERSMLSWHNPFGVVLATFFLGYEHACIVPKESTPERDKLFSLRSLWFGRDLSAREWLLLMKDVSPNNMWLLHLLKSERTHYLDEEQFFRDFINLSRMYPRLGDWINGAAICIPSIFRKQVRLYICRADRYKNSRHDERVEKKEMARLRKAARRDIRAPLEIQLSSIFFDENLEKFVEEIPEIDPWDQDPDEEEAQGFFPLLHREDYVPPEVTELSPEDEEWLKNEFPDEENHEEIDPWEQGEDTDVEEEEIIDFLGVKKSSIIKIEDWEPEPDYGSDIDENIINNDDALNDFPEEDPTENLEDDEDVDPFADILDN